jgi:hypothetical protein
MMQASALGNIRALDMQFLDDLLGMDGGYVLHFSDRTFAQFFAEEVGIDIDDPTWAANGGSKGKRMRFFLQTADKPTVVRALKAIWEHREAGRERTGEAETIKDAHGRLLALIARLEGRSPPVVPATATEPPRVVDPARIARLKAELTALAARAPQARGYAFERLLKDLFDAFGLSARASFRLVGEQIDGSFELDKETYLVEAKWQDGLTGTADLHVFHGKLEQKVVWARGAFVSYAGFSKDGLAAFGRRKQLVCMDGLDLFEALDRGIGLDRALRAKVRRASETGAPFVRLRDLFP